MKEKKKRLNSDIRATRVQVIHDTDGNLGEMSFTDALSRAKEEELDLMEMGEKDGVTLVKMIDY